MEKERVRKGYGIGWDAPPLGVPDLGRRGRLHSSDGGRGIALSQ